MADVELAWTNLDRPAKRFSWQVGVHQFGHPTEKPLPLMIWTLQLIDGQTILDPFMGSGTTAVACIRTGRKFIGCEIDPKYFEIACKRVQKAWDEERTSLLTTASKIEQLELFGAAT